MHPARANTATLQGRGCTILQVPFGAQMPNVLGCSLLIYNGLAQITSWGAIANLAGWGSDVHRRYCSRAPGLKAVLRSMRQNFLQCQCQTSLLRTPRCRHCFASSKTDSGLLSGHIAQSPLLILCGASVGCAGEAVAACCHVARYAGTNPDTASHLCQLGRGATRTISEPSARRAGAFADRCLCTAARKVRLLLCLVSCPVQEASLLRPALPSPSAEHHAAGPKSSRRVPFCGPAMTVGQAILFLQGMD